MTQPFRLAGHTRDEQPTYINLQDRARIKRVFASMLFAGGLPIHNVKLDDLSFEEILKTLEQLSKRLEGAAEDHGDMLGQLAEHQRIFDALKALGRLIKEDSND